MQFNVAQESEYITTLLKGNEWPEAVLPELVYLSTDIENHHKRANAIFNQFFKSLSKIKKILDFGCGEGLLALRIAQAGATLSVGYDIKHGNLLNEWEQPNQNYLLTKDFNRVRQHAPYDVIILYDVIDHLVNCNIDELMNQIKVLTTTGTIMILRCHPWTSRNSETQLSVLNRAFSRIVLNNEESRTLALSTENLSNKFSLSNYRKSFLNNPYHFMPTISFKYHPYVWLRESIKEAPIFLETLNQCSRRASKKSDWFSISSEYIHRRAVEPFFFKNKIVKERIISNLNKHIFRLPIISNSVLRNLLEITYVDYTLVVK